MKWSAFPEDPVRDRILEFFSKTIVNNIAISGGFFLSISSVSARTPVCTNVGHRGGGWGTFSLGCHVRFFRHSCPKSHLHIRKHFQQMAIKCVQEGALF